MSIRDPRKYVSTLWDWGVLKGCFGQTRIEPTDIDGWVERNGRYLVIETKSPQQKMPTGQRITFERMASRGYHTVLVVWGDPGQPEKILIIRENLHRWHIPADMTLLRCLVTRWFEWADNQIPPPVRADTIDWDRVLEKETEAEDNRQDADEYDLEDLVPPDIQEEWDRSFKQSSQGRLF